MQPLRAGIPYRTKHWDISALLNRRIRVKWGVEKWEFLRLVRHTVLVTIFRVDAMPPRVNGLEQATDLSKRPRKCRRVEQISFPEKSPATAPKGPNGDSPGERVGERNPGKPPPDCAATTWRTERDNMADTLEEHSVRHVVAGQSGAVSRGYARRNF